MQIRILNESDVEGYRNLRLRALQTNPESFGSTYEKELAYSLETFKERVRPSQEKFVLGAYDGETLIGMAVFVRETDRKTYHRGNIYSMYVAPETRGQGVAKAILLDLIEKARNEEGIEQLHLTVVSSNLSAKKLYESLGFETYGVEPRALKDIDQYYDEDLMVLFLD